MSFYEKTLSEEIIYEGRVVKLKKQTVLLPNGKTSIREIIEKSDAITVVPITHDGKIVFVRQFRKAIERETLETPAGFIDQGETPLEAALRELKEETGYTSNNIELIVSAYPSSGTSTNKVYLFIARDLEKLSATLDLDEDEFLSSEELTMDEAEQALIDGLICNFPTVLALFYLKQNM